MIILICVVWCSYVLTNYEHSTAGKSRSTLVHVLPGRARVPLYMYCRKEPEYPCTCTVRKSPSTLVHVLPERARVPLYMYCRKEPEYPCTCTAGKSPCTCTAGKSPCTCTAGRSPCTCSAGKSPSTLVHVLPGRAWDSEYPRECTSTFGHCCL